jgi:hypothetical protein
MVAAHGDFLAIDTTILGSCSTNCFFDGIDDWFDSLFSGGGLSFFVRNKMTTMRYCQDHKSRIIRDVLGVLVLLSLGIGGQTFLLNPVGILTPDLPMLSREELPNSAATPVYEDSQSGSISQQREFHVTLIIGEEDQTYRGDGWLSNKGATISQKVFWYAEPTEAVFAWEQSENEIKDEFSNIPPMVSNSLGENNPASSLYCSDEPNNRRICVYLSYWKHWHTEIRFLSGGDEYLSFTDIQNLSAKATELLMSAPDKP